MFDLAKPLNNHNIQFYALRKELFPKPLHTLTLLY